MDIEIKVPSLGESETEATLISWLKQEGDAVALDDVLAEIESDKITMEITALDAGVLKRILKPVESTVEPGEVVAIIDSNMQAETGKKAAASTTAQPAVVKEKEAPVKQKKTVDKPEPAAKAAEPVVPAEEALATKTAISSERSEQRVAMSGLRRRIATRLKQAQNTAAMLTTFNEVNLQAVTDLRSRYGAAFQDQHGVKLGFMSFFVRAVCQGLIKYPALNACIEGDDIVYHNYVDVGIAVGTDKGLVVPVLRDAGMMGFAQIESGIAELARKAREGGLMPDDLKGATFSITNGGVFGSLLSTPILNPPQSAILGMHAIQRRPVAEGEQVVIRPMMYLALTYDHRLIDGREAVQFLVDVKSYLENPGLVLLDL